MKSCFLTLFPHVSNRGTTAGPVRVVKENKSWSEPVPGFQITESGTFHYLNAWNRIGVDEPIRWLSYENSSVSHENNAIQTQNLSVLLTGLIQASSSMFNNALLQR